MSRLPTLHGDGLMSDPREIEQPPAPSVNPEIQELFDRAMQGELPRSRELKAWEPARLNETHIAMIMARAGGMRQNLIAQVFGVKDSNVSVVMNHPDAVYLLSRLQAARFSRPTAYEARIEALTEDAIGAIEDLLQDAEISPLKKAPSAFALLKMNGYGQQKKEPETVNHVHTLDGTAKELALLSKALRESKEIPNVHYTDVTPVPGSGPVPGPSPALYLSSPADTDAPSVGGSQELRRREIA